MKWLALMVAGLLTLAGGAQALTLTNDGRTRFVIAVADDAIAPEMTAATELQTYLESVTGARLAIMPEAQVREGAAQIVLGPSARFKEGCPDVDLEALKHDGIVIRTEGNRLYLAGGRPRGTLYAVYSFLEDAVGIRWWSSRGEDTVVPDLPTLEVPAQNLVYTPKLQYREAFYRDAFDGVYAARSKCNGHFERVPAEYGGHYTLLGWCHTFYQILPPEKYFKDHPEWYSMINGERTGNYTQLCLTNDEMREEFTRVALEWIRKDPTAGMISVAQNDWAGNCQCENCKAIEDREEAPSGLLIEFVNKVAADIQKEYPDFLIETLAYQYTRKPPLTVRPRENVVVRLCSIECSFVQPLGTGEQNATFQRDIAGWKPIADKLYIWDYVTDFANYILPHPNMRSLAPNIRYFVDNNVIGLFEQGDAGSSCGDFVELRAWLLAHLMWDPSRDENALISEFLQGYYGAAAEPIARYINLIHDTAEASGAYIGCFMPDNGSWMNFDCLNQSTLLWDQAAEAVKDDTLLSARVRRARLPLDHTWLQRYWALKRLAQVQGTPFLGPADPVAGVEDYITTADLFAVGSHREGGAFSDYAAALREKFQPASPSARPTEAEGIADSDWMDIQQGEFTLANSGVWVTLVDDAKASDGRAARMPGDHNNWAVQYPVPGDFGELGAWRAYAVVRADLKAQTGPACDIGLYDGPGSRAMASRRLQAEELVDGEYHVIDLGSYDLKGGNYLWVAPVSDGGAAEAVYVDRFFIIKEQ